MSHIYSIGSGTRSQASMREDGVWFMRRHRDGKPGWGKWHKVIDNKRPEHAWYNPAAGNSKLPKDTDNEQITEWFTERE